jgi:hypothetical protein
VSPESVQLFEIALVACVFAAVIIILARKGRISFRYTMGWLSLGALGVLGGMLRPVISPISNRLRLDEFSFVAAIAIMVLLCLCVQLSISVSGIQNQLRKLNENHALLRNNLEDLRDTEQ